MPAEGAPQRGKPVAVVTGAGTGIGRFIATQFGAQGYRVAALDVDMAALCSAERERPAPFELQTLQCDVRDPVQVGAAFAAIVGRFGRIDCLVNNAAIVPHFAWGLPHWPRVRDMDFGFWSDVVATNLHGVFLCTRAALGPMEAQRAGHVINVYGGKREPSSGHTAYRTSKEAVASLTRHLAAEERDYGVCVLAVHPGHGIATERAPAVVRAALPGPDSVGDRFLLAARAGLDLSGRVVDFIDGALVPVE